MQLIIGRKPVLEAINSGDEIEQVYLLFGQKGDIINTIIVAAKKKGIKLSQLPYNKFIAITDRKSTRLNSSHLGISYAVFCLKKKKKVDRQHSAQAVYLAPVYSTTLPCQR